MLIYNPSLAVYEPSASNPAAYIETNHRLISSFDSSGVPLYPLDVRGTLVAITSRDIIRMCREFQLQMRAKREGRTDNPQWVDGLDMDADSIGKGAEFAARYALWERYREYGWRVSYPDLSVWESNRGDKGDLKLTHPELPTVSVEAKGTRKQLLIPATWEDGPNRARLTFDSCVWCEPLWGNSNTVAYPPFSYLVRGFVLPNDPCFSRPLVMARKGSHLNYDIPNHEVHQF